MIRRSMLLLMLLAFIALFIGKTGEAFSQYAPAFAPVLQVEIQMDRATISEPTALNQTSDMKSLSNPGQGPGEVGANLMAYSAMSFAGQLPYILLRSARLGANSGDLSAMNLKGGLPLSRGTRPKPTG